MPTILQVLPSLGTGGVERGTVDIARALTEAGWRAIVASSGGPMVREVQRAGAVHVVLPVDSKNPVVMWRNVARLQALIAEHRVDIVHARSRAPAWSAMIAAKRAGVKFMTTFHGHYNAGNPAKSYYNSIMARGDRIIAISDFIGRHVVERYGADPGIVRVIPRGVDLVIFDSGAVSAERVIQVAQAWRVPDDARVVMLPGRLTRWKGQGVLIEALGRIDTKGVRCILVGDDQGRERYRLELENRVKRLGLESVVQLPGHCADMAAAYKLADVVVSASTDPEAFGRVIAEAQAMGRPVIATDHGAARETVQEGVTGWLVAPGDAGALAVALREALALTPDQRAALAERAMAHVRGRYTRAAMCASTLDVYAELLAGAGQAG